MNFIRIVLEAGEHVLIRADALAGCSALVVYARVGFSGLNSRIPR
jgi:hypothetical protein